MNDPSTLRQTILEHLSEVIDPETGVDVIRMRLVEALTVDQAGHVQYTFHPSSPLCPLAVSLALKIKQAIAQVPGVNQQTIQVTGYVQAQQLTELLNQPAPTDSKQA